MIQDFVELSSLRTSYAPGYLSKYFLAGHRQYGPEFSGAFLSVLYESLLFDLFNLSVISSGHLDCALDLVSKVYSSVFLDFADTIAMRGLDPICVAVVFRFLENRSLQYTGNANDFDQLGKMLQSSEVLVTSPACRLHGIKSLLGGDEVDDSVCLFFQNIEIHTMLGHCRKMNSGHIFPGLCQDEDMAWVVHYDDDILSSFLLYIIYNKTNFIYDINDEDKLLIINLVTTSSISRSLSYLMAAGVSRSDLLHGVAALRSYLNVENSTRISWSMIGHILNI